MRRVLRIHEPLVDSTMNAILQHLEFLKENPQSVVVFTADTQTAGRGREGREWVTAGKSVATSFALEVRSRKDPTLLQVLALAVTTALDELYLSQDFKVKWPNDVMLLDRKVGGMIAEWHGDMVVLGFGINLKVPNEAFPDRTLWPAGSIELLLNTTRSYEPCQVVEAVLNSFLTLFEGWEARNHCGKFRESLNHKLFKRGDLVTLRTADEPIEGVVEGVDDKGELVLRLRTGELFGTSSGEIVA